MVVKHQILTFCAFFVFLLITYAFMAMDGRRVAADIRGRYPHTGHRKK